MVLPIWSDTACRESEVGGLIEVPMISEPADAAGPVRSRISIENCQETSPPATPPTRSELVPP